MSAPTKESAGSTSVSTLSICAACGQEFSCAMNDACGAVPSDCWCFDLKLSEAAREELQSRFQGCLCNRCLASYGAEQPQAQK